MDSAAARAQLLAHPETFLKHYPVKCAGAAAPNQNAVNLRLYNISKRQGLANVDGHRGATRPGLFGYQREISSWILQPGAAVGNGTTINQAHVVPMVNHLGVQYGCLNLLGNVTAMPYYELDGTGDGLMVTGELSNCCFTWAVQGANLWCIHVQPVGGITPTGLQAALATTGRFAAAPHVPLATFGRDEYPVGRASVVGVRQAGAWSLYAQTSNDLLNTISAAYRIYPGAMTRL
ncbi:hypothetical protein ASD55_11845 [Rhodanobacter sp. Root561]|uniref:hypothetical protein n=1 Tax=Rhodanobacter sp. Root561 TaxID=1736560 RepID=UPI0006FAA6D7|nr:hypothetical protein [Rhodanobacter sp. Root561]KQZ70967.1 hypothetical protein ASD55_11845 [Rhodanobacter sp. Root561]